MPYLVGMKLREGREGLGDGHENDPDHLRNAEEAYLQLSELYGWTQIDCAPDGTFETLRTPEAIQEEVFKRALEVLVDE
ncbi:hypothetical protein HN604_02055 [archaeon]|jgi:hypothetical protein|nr:hypothetical protein [archaeon]MBT6182614.1 hypothetical protein [archaeon]MBT6606226.1 hypothetical protein [archaeon]MBT7660846.1 hypothetical protein [archaeon]